MLAGFLGGVAAVTFPRERFFAPCHERWRAESTVRDTPRAHSFGIVDRGERIGDGAGITRSNQPSDFPAIAQEYERGPELHFEGASERAPASIGNLNVAYARVSSECGRDNLLGGTTVAATWATELKQGWTGESVDVGTFGFFSYIVSFESHINGCSLAIEFRYPGLEPVATTSNSPGVLGHVGCRQLAYW